MTMTQPRNGDIGLPNKEIEFEPFPETAPIETPVEPIKAPEPVPA